MDWHTWSDIAGAFLLRIADTSIRAIALAAIAAVLALFLRRRASAEHAVWTGLLVGMLALSALRPVVPAVRVFQLPEPVLRATRSMGNLPAYPGDAFRLRPFAPARPAPARFAWPMTACTIAYMLGFVLFGSRLMLGMLWTRRLLRDSRSVGLELKEHAGLLADFAARVEESDHVRVPITIGWRYMRIILPVEWRGWTVRKTRVILAHELAHARRRDPLIASAARANQCLFWFHPLAWWLERRLATLAEEVADDAGLAVAGDASAYARTLLEVASRLEGQGTRLVWDASAMGGSKIARRIRRVLDPRTQQPAWRIGTWGRDILLSCAVLLVCLSAAVDVKSAAQVKENPPGFGFVFSGMGQEKMTAEQAATMEQRLAADPEDIVARSTLLRYYWRNNLHQRRIPLVLWLIDHHPESPLHRYETAVILPRGSSGGNTGIFEDARSRWLTQVDLHPNDPRVLGNAARALTASSIPESIELMKRAHQLDSQGNTQPLARFYALVLVWSNKHGRTRTPFQDLSLATQIRNELRESSDLPLVGTVARYFVEDATARPLLDNGNWDFPVLRTIGAELVAHAQALEPRNRDWADLMEGVIRLPDVSVSSTGAPHVQ